MKKYRLEYFLMCGIDGSVDDKASWKEIEAKDDKSAVQKATKYLKKEFYEADGSNKTSIIPWGPWLYDGQRLVASAVILQPES